MKILKSELKTIIKEVINEESKKNISSKNYISGMFEIYNNICIVDSGFIKSNGGSWNQTSGSHCKRIKVNPGKYEIKYIVAGIKSGIETINVPSGEIWVGDCSCYWDGPFTEEWKNFLHKNNNNLGLLNLKGQIYINTGINDKDLKVKVSWKSIK